MGAFLSNSKFPIVAFIIWRTTLFVLSYLSVQLIPFTFTFPYIDYFLTTSGYPDWVWQFGNFDGVHYLGIAINGYQAAGTHVFFPLYPLLIKLGALVTHNHLLSALLISNISFLLALIIFFNFLKKNFSDQIAKWSILFLVCFPTSFFFGSVYTEGLFFLLLIISFFGDSYKSGLALFFASCTKILGVFASFSLLLEKHKRKYALFGLFGFVLYIVFTWYTYGNPMLIISDQQAFQNARASSLTSLVTPPQVVWRYMKIFATASFDRYATWLAVLEFISFVGSFTLLVVMLRKKTMRLSWLIFSFFAILVPAVSGTFSSMPRYVLMCFPIYIFLGSLERTWLRVLLLAMSLSFEVVLSVLFLRGFFIA